MAAPVTSSTGSDTAGWLTLVLRAGTTESTAFGGGHSTQLAGGGSVSHVKDAKGNVIGFRIYQPPILP